MNMFIISSHLDQLCLLHYNNEMGWKQRALITFISIFAITNCIFLYAFQDSVLTYYQSHLVIREEIAVEDDAGVIMKDEQDGNIVSKTTAVSCEEDASVLKETYGKAIENEIVKMTEMNLCQSLKQMTKFHSVKDKVMSWLQSHPEKNKLILDLPNGNNYAVAVNDKYAYLHVFKNGGSTVSGVTNNAHTKSKDLGDERKLFTTVRDPIDHFLSGWAECGYRSESPDDDPAFTLDVSIDSRIESWMDCVEAFIEGGRDACTNCAKHSYPQSSFMMHPDDLESIHPSLEMIGDLKELEGMLEVAGFTDYDESKRERSSSENAIKVERYPRDKTLLSDKTLQRICDFVVLDYLLFDFDPPAACRDQLQSDIDSIAII